MSYQVGDKLPEITLPLTLHRLVMEAGANRDLSMIHHDKDVAKATGAPDAYANTYFLMGLFERQLREWIGLNGQIRKIGPMAMKTFNCVGDVICVQGEVSSIDEGQRKIGVEQTITSARGVTTSCKSIVTY